ncbi:MAG: UTP--glucose-1-phosphate uridylyltransferase [Candidatus Aminicenantes bacterium]|nr:UTP--glucose-1-phosphate uridylyltransferase [Candidatus Aminicenantes bacterium]
MPKVRKVLIPAAGFGTRSLPASKAVPKEMLPLVDKPLIQVAVEEAVAAGFSEIGIIIAPWKTAIRDHFGPSPALEAFLAKKGRADLLDGLRRIQSLAEITFLEQREQLGLGHAVSMGEAFAAGEPVAVMNPDTVYDCDVPCLGQLKAVFEETGAATVVLGRIGPEETRTKGVARVEPIRGNVYRVLDLVEKPGPENAPSDMGVLGRYVFTPGVFEAIRATRPGYGGEIQITDAIRILLGREPVRGVLFEGRRFDAGEPGGYIEAFAAFAAKRREPF